MLEKRIRSQADDRRQGHAQSVGVKEIAREYFDTALFLLSYEPDAAYGQLQSGIVKLICHVYDAQAEEAASLQSIRQTACLRTAADGMLMSNTDAVPRNAILDMKLERLTAQKITQLKIFDRAVFFSEVEHAAYEGNVSACKLLAMLHWLDMCPDSSREMALSVWEMLAMSGDHFAIRALVKAFAQLERPKEEAMWRHILEILEAAHKSFAPMVMEADFPGYSDEEMDTANLILYISQKAAKQEGFINRSMLYYALNSHADYAVIMGNLSTVQNFHLAMRMEQRSVTRRIGF